jgi:hypothetical protein
LLRHFENGTRAPGLLRNPGCCLIQCPQNRGKVTLTGAGGVSNVATATISVTASVAGSLSGTVSAAAPPYNLTTLRTHDWRHLNEFVLNCL